MITKRDIPKSEQAMYHAAYLKCKEQREKSISQPIGLIIAEVVRQFGGIVTSKDDLSAFLQEEVSANIEPIIFPISDEIRKNAHNWWSIQKDQIDTRYWNRYHTYMLNKPAWGEQAVDDIDVATDEMMNVLAQPGSHEPCERIGMAFGYVQSGKTAHYMGLINKALDSGYKIIIVLSGIHNSLRSQTQSRIDKEVLGYETSIEQLNSPEQFPRSTIGVGKIGSVNMTQSLTTRDEKGDINKSVMKVTMSPPFIIVTKKNATVLKHMISFFTKNPMCSSTANGEKQVPVLVIDDEADQASVNTKECFDSNGNVLPDYKTSTINGAIRKLLNLFTVRTYVGYTATPFANIFIPPDIHSDEYGSDLFPRDFLMRIPRAKMYIGAKEFFGLNEQDSDTRIDPMPLYREIITGAGFLSKGTTEDDPVGNLPTEMVRAIRCFIISVAVRNLRGMRNMPNSMLIHVIRYKSQQNKLKKKVKEKLEELLDNFRYGDATTINDFRVIWDIDYKLTTDKMKSNFSIFMGKIPSISWDKVYEEIRTLAHNSEIKVMSVNGSSKDSLAYTENEGKPFNVIVIGGDKLSRGLTLEGLSVSYFTRCAGAYDTLMQMGRWFGYRPGYADLCRLYTTQDLYNAYYRVSLATEDLVEQFDDMNDIHMSPEKFGLRVLSYTDLLISSRNKIRTGAQVEAEFSADRSQTRLLDIEMATVESNATAVEQLLTYLGKPTSVDVRGERTQKHLLWHSIPYNQIINFLNDYKTSERAGRANSLYMAKYIKNQVSVGQLTGWNVCFINVGEPGWSFAQFDGLGKGGERKALGVMKDTCDIHTLMSDGDEYLDYTQDQLERVGKVRFEHRGERHLAKIIRQETRKTGCLFIYPLHIRDSQGNTLANGDVIFGIAVVFPDRHGKGKVESYRLNEIGLRYDDISMDS